MGPDEGQRSSSVHGATVAAGFVAAVMIAQQIAGKATRDAVFLSKVGASELPIAMLAAAVLSIASVFCVSRIMSRVGPQRVASPVFVLSGVLFVGEWFVFEASPVVVAWLLYLHLGAIGATVISAFWSVVSERFDPHEAKRAVARIGVAATFGGLVGGVGAERLAALLDVRTVLLVLGAMNLVCAVGLARASSPSRSAGAPTDVSGLEVLRTTPYVRHLAVLVAVVAMTAALVDFAFKAEAAAVYATDRALMRFFSLFYAGVGLLTFVLQSGVARRALARLGADKTVAFLPAGVLVAALIGAGFTRLWTVALTRGLEMVLANSLFRSGYELLFTPLAPEKKRPTKAIIDVALDRLGDAGGSAVVLVVLAVAPAYDGQVVLALAAIGAVIALLIVRSLGTGYVDALADSLKTGMLRLDEQDILDATTQQTLTETSLAMERDELLRQIEELRRQSRVDGFAAEEGVRARIVAEVEALLSGDEARIREVLSSEHIERRIVPFVIPLLGSNLLRSAVIDGLVRSLPTSTGTLVDAMLDPAHSVVVRRRLPLVLERSDDDRAARGLFRGLEDRRFEVRYRCGQALAHLRTRRGALPLGHEEVMTAVRRELEAEPASLDQATDLPDEPEAGPAWLHQVVERRIHRRLEHVFALLSLVLDREALQLSLRALYGEDRRLRGTALEYLESTLPTRIRKSLWPYLAGDKVPSRKPRARDVIVDDLQRSLDR